MTVMRESAVARRTSHSSGFAPRPNSSTDHPLHPTLDDATTEPDALAIRLCLGRVVFAEAEGPGVAVATDVHVDRPAAGLSQLVVTWNDVKASVTHRGHARGMSKPCAGREGAPASGGRKRSSVTEPAMIRRLKSGEYRLYSVKKNPKTGKRRNLGTFKTRAAAEKHEREVQYFKRH